MNISRGYVPSVGGRAADVHSVASGDVRSLRKWRQRTVFGLGVLALVVIYYYTGVGTEWPIRTASRLAMIGVSAIPDRSPIFPSENNNQISISSCAVVILQNIDTPQVLVLAWPATYSILCSTRFWSAEVEP